MTRPSACLASLLLCTLSVGAHAQSTAADQSDARTLFEEGVTLMEKGDHAHACPKLAASVEAHRTNGNVAHLADCYEHLGKRASAHALWSSLVSRGNAEQSRIAQARVDALEPELCRLRIRLEEAADEAEVSWNDRVLRRSELQAELAVDPGRHHFVVKAAGHADAVHTAVFEDCRGTTRDIALALGGPTPGPTPPQPTLLAPAPAMADESSMPWLRTSAWTLGGVGLATSVAVFATWGAGQYAIDDAQRECGAFLAGGASNAVPVDCAALDVPEAALAQSNQVTGENMRLAGQIMLAPAAAMLITSVVLFAVSPDDTDDADIAVGPGSLRFQW